MIVSRIALDGTPAGAPDEVALDPGLDAGPGDVVLVAKEGAVVADLFDADRAEGDGPTPANVVVIAVVDDWAPRA